MKKEEKKIIFDLLKTTDSYINGYISKTFEENIEFEDDLINKDENNIKKLPQKITIDEINKKINLCTRCNLCKTRNHVVCGSGSDNPNVLIISDAPLYDDDIQGLPFSGQEGKLLDKMLSAINLSRETDCYITNVIKCRPAENRNPNNEEIDSCYSFLETQINILKPKIILCMGISSFPKLLKTESTLSEIHGKIFEFNKIPLIVTYSPSALIKNEELKRPAWNDLKIFRKKMDEIC